MILDDKAGVTKLKGNKILPRSLFLLYLHYLYLIKLQRPFSLQIRDFLELYICNGVMLFKMVLSNPFYVIFFYIKNSLFENVLLSSAIF